jgi:hypothetical protein
VKVSGQHGPGAGQYLHQEDARTSRASIMTVKDPCGMTVKDLCGPCSPLLPEVADDELDLAQVQSASRMVIAGAFAGLPA